MAKAIGCHEPITVEFSTSELVHDHIVKTMVRQRPGLNVLNVATGVCAEVPVHGDGTKIRVSIPGAYVETFLAAFGCVDFDVL